MAFAAYGRMGGWDLPTSSCNGGTITPYMMCPHGRWGLEQLRFTEDEFLSFVKEFINLHLPMMDHEDVGFLTSYIQKETARHPGLTAFFLEKIRPRFSLEIREREKLTFKKTFSYFVSADFKSAVSSVSVMQCLFY